MVRGILLARVSPREVDDLVQEVFLAVLRQLHALRDVSRFGAWLASITGNRANDYYRTSSPQVALTKPVSGDKSGERVNQHAGEFEAAMILDVIRTLPEAYREPIILRLDHQMLDTWWNSLGYGDISLWRTHEQDWSKRMPNSN
jgi:RNA polymerase sigma factor (sigma-70 family)